MRLGIDFGTCFSSAQTLVGGGVFDFSENKNGIPTLFMYDPTTETNHFGYDCEGQRYAIYNGDSVVRYIKTKVRLEPHKLNDSRAIVSGGKSFSYRDVIANYLRFLIDKAKRDAMMALGDDTVEEICITAPAAIGTTLMLSTEYREMLIDVLKEVTGLAESRISVLPEPVAAAIHYLNALDGEISADSLDSNSEKAVEDQTVLVFDLGGGTLDVTLMNYSFRNGTPLFSVERIDGDPELGGNLWDKTLGEYVLSAKFGVAANQMKFSDSYEEYMFRKAITEAKIDLSTMPRVLCSVGLNGEPKVAYVTVEEFEGAVAHLVERAMNVTQRVVNSYDGGINGINKIILVGGSSNMPHIRKAIETTFPTFNRENILLHEPSKAIAKGAAIYTGFDGGRVTPVFTGIIENSYGWGAINAEKIPPREMIYNLLMKETKFGTESSISLDADSAFRATEDQQTRVVFTVYESNVRASDCEGGHWIDFGEGQKTCGIEVSIPVPPEYAGKARSFKLYPRMVMDKNGVLRLEIYDANGNLLGAEQKHVHG